MGTNWASNSFSSGGNDAWTTRATRFKNSQGGASPNGGGNLGMNAGANAPQPNAPAAQPALGGFDDTQPSRAGMLGPEMSQAAGPDFNAFPDMKDDWLDQGGGLDVYGDAQPDSPLPYSNTVGPQMTDESMYTADGSPAYGQNLTYGMPADGWQANLTGQPAPPTEAPDLFDNYSGDEPMTAEEIYDSQSQERFDSMPESWYSDPGPQWETDPDYQITSGPNGGSSYRSKFYDPEMAAKYGNLGNQRPRRPDRGTANGRDMGGGAVHYGNQGSYYDSMRQRERGLYFGG